MSQDGNYGVAMAFIFLALALLILFAVVLWGVSPAKSETPSTGVAFCSLYARESVRIDLMHTIPVKASEVTDDYIKALAVRVFKECVSVIPALLPLPEQHRSLDTWVNDMRRLIESREDTAAMAGTEPASIGSDEWRAQCERTYRTWNEETGMVLRKGSPDPVRCPCGTEVVCE